MTTCPIGHQSAATDFCDVCGRPIGAPVPAPRPPVGEPSAPVRGADEKCPLCQGARTGRFCEQDGYDFEAPPELSVAAGAVWTAVVRADRHYFDSVTEGDGEPMDPARFPAGLPERQFQLTGARVVIGRRSAARGIEPDIDLSGPPADTGVSRQHAVLVAEPDGTWSLVDQGSANGTLLNGVEVTPHQRASLHDGDEISIGRWTVLRIKMQPSGLVG